MTAEQIIADQAVPFADFPTETMSYQGRQIQVLVMSDGGNIAWEEGGRLLDPVITLAAERSQFEGAGVAPPIEGQVGISFRNKSYRIGEIHSEDAQASYKFTLISEAK